MQVSVRSFVAVRDRLVLDFALFCVLVARVLPVFLVLVGGAFEVERAPDVAV
jgi:hypothetical protein